MNLETLLELPPVMNSDVDGRDLHRHLERIGQELSLFGRRLKEVTWELERLAGASSDMPETRMARARLGQSYAEAGRLKLAMAIPDGLRERNQRGTNERESFCKQITAQAVRFFTKARGYFEACLDRPGAPHLEASVLCRRELDRLPPP